MGGSERIKRNDPCPCGSGKKYKKCCLKRDRAEQAERVAWEHAARCLRMALVDFAKDQAFVADLAAALGLFWQDRYTVDLIHQMSVDETLRFFDWFVHDYRLQFHHDARYLGKRLIEVYRAEVGNELSDIETSILNSWLESPPGSAFLLEELDPSRDAVIVKDLCLENRVVTVRDHSASAYGELGQILLARPLPGKDSLYFSGATVILPAVELDRLCEFVQAEQETYSSEHNTTSMESFLRDRAYLLTHYALEWADRQGRPAVAADDPDAHEPGAKFVQKMIKWKRDQVQIQ